MIFCLDLYKMQGVLPVLRRSLQLNLATPTRNQIENVRTSVQFTIIYQEKRIQTYVGVFFLSFLNT